MKKLLLLPFIILSIYLRADDFSVSSPDKNITIKVKTTDRIYYAVDFKGKEIMWYSPLSMTLDKGRVLGQNPKVSKQETASSNATIKTVWGIRNQIHDHYNQLEIFFEGNYSVIFRAFNDGVAYRFKTDISGEITVVNEEVAYRFLENHDLIAHVVGDFQTSYEKLYTRYKLADVVEDEFVSLPLVVKQPNVRIAITESDLYDYPGMYVKRPGNNNRFFLEGLFPQLPTKWEPGGWCQFNLRVTERADYLAKTSGKRAFPWRVMAIGDEDIDLADNDLVYQLARPS
ncbi:MAG: glycoside hydrolase family 97 N-terminal domain-containing protein, partial [Bacteroidetes bacterium]|nr:glycoside hydrolase family 97 N-terminal domain-containing protein [Bacteroidota bacterium]